MKRALLLLVLFIHLFRGSAQLMVYGIGDPATAALAHLNGANVLLTNAISQTIDPQQVGVFSDPTASIGLDSGLVISTGIIYGLLGPNNIPNMTLGGGFFASDPDLSFMSLLTASVIGDPGILQMDLVPQGDTLEVRYVFGSEEYDEYACSDKDDRLGMFLSGPGLAGTFSNGAINMATLPISGLPVTVNTLNRGVAGSEGALGLCGMNAGWEQDTIYYINNDFGTGTQLDGYTVVLTARAVVVPGLMYHLKIAIADVNDGNFDSAVFLPEGAIRCTDLSTAVVAPAGPDPGLRYDPNTGTLHLRSSVTGGGPALIEVFDATARLLERTTALSDGPMWSAHLESRPTSMFLVRASWPGGTLARRLFVP
ncbi:MAG: choice-of-anchor L domain-containing protein [Flavobacteriales bacterium]|nr:choice-of-anchor L domain-containing protein [Flavobacteriales bacterium]